MQKGYTEADPREDLEGLDVARKLIILAREINYPAQLNDVKVQNLIPKSNQNTSSLDAFLSDTKSLDIHYDKLKSSLQKHEVLNYIAELDVENKTLSVNLQSVPLQSPIGQLKNADSLFEIYTDSYGNQPIIIQGAGAGSKVTARAVYSDLVRIGHRK